MGRPLLLEGEAGVGKTEIAKVLSTVLGRDLIRLQCYEGLDAAAAVYEWNYAQQMMAIRLGEAAGDTDRGRLEGDIFSDRYLIKRPLLQALEPHANGAPILTEAPGALECKVTSIVEQGDHHVVVAEVTEAHLMKPMAGRPDAAILEMKDLGDNVFYGG